MGSKQRDANAIGPARQEAEIELRFGKHTGMRLSTSVTPGGIAAVALLVSGILLSTAVIVRTARRPQPQPLPPMLRLPR